jgi:hypothetical protein
MSYLFKTDELSPRHTIIKLAVPGAAGETETLNVHQGVLCQSSEFFKRSMKPDWAGLRDVSSTIELPTDNVDTVSDYIKWLYTGSLSLKLYEGGDKENREKVAVEAEKVFVLLAEAYVFGEKILDTKYKNVVLKGVEAAKNSSQWNMGPESVDIVYKGTAPRSPLRRLIAGSVAFLAHDDTEKGVGWMTFFEGYPKEALKDAIKAMARLRSRPEKYAELKAELLESCLEKE